MCTFSLTTLSRSCGHELPTLSYCSAAKPGVKAYERAQKIGKPVKPPKTCTESYGWMLYKSLEIPVSYESCIGWLGEKGKRTYGGVAAQAGSRSDGGRKKRIKREGLEDGGRKVKFEEDDADEYDAEMSDEELDEDSDAGLLDEANDQKQKNEEQPVAFYAPPTPGQQRRYLHASRNW